MPLAIAGRKLRYCGYWFREGPPGARASLVTRASGVAVGPKLTDRASQSRAGLSAVTARLRGWDYHRPPSCTCTPFNM